MLDDPSEGQDVAQETFLRLLRAGLDSDDPRRVTAWIYRTSTRLAIDRMRRRRVQAPQGEASWLETDAPDAEQTVSSRQQWRLLANAVPSRELELALLARFDGLTQSEISEVAGVSERTVRRLLARFDERLERLQRKGRHDGRS